MAATYPVEPPDPNTPLKKACTVLARETDLDYRILASLAKGAERYSGLKPLLGDRGDHNLTVSLKRLQAEGLLRRRAMAAEGREVHRYELSELGEQTLELIRRIEEVARQPPERTSTRQRPTASEPAATWHVTPAEEGGWRVVRVGSDRATSRHETKDEAVDRGREIARRQHGRLVLHYKDGRFQRHVTYGEA